MATPILFTVDHVDHSDDLEWSLRCEEVLGGIGRYSLVIQDRTNTYEPRAHADIKAVIRSSGWVLGRGEIITEPEDLPVGMPWRKWVLDCADYNNEFPQRLVGAFDGKTWIDQYGLGVFVNIDPNAMSLETDRLTVQNLFDKYIRVDGEAFDTTTFVGEYLRDFFPLTWEYGNLQTSLEELAALIVKNLQFWSDPDLKVHWVTIPAWQDLAQDLAAVFGNPTTSTTAMMFPEAEVGFLAFAPADASDIADGSDPNAIGFSDLKFTYDGSVMPEQVYVKGGTGYVYNAPPIPPADETKTVVSVPTPGVAATYELTFLATTKLWHTDGTGFVSTSYDTVGASGPYKVRYVEIPWSPSRNKGGHFWKLEAGPDSGKLVDNDTNVLAGYGSIKVVRVALVPGTPEDPKIGIGGSGWVNEGSQDPNKRQAYLDAPVSVSKDMRDSFGGQAEYRGKTPTLRGTLKVRGIDGWRAGQLLRITDSRLPASLNGKYFIIQGVGTSLVAATDIREYDLSWGDGPTSRYSAQADAGGDAGWPPPAIQIEIDARDLSPGPNSSQVITGQLINGSGEPWAIAGKVMNWSFECYNAAGILQTDQGSITPTVAITDKHGKARTTLTTGPGTNLVYYMFANVVAT